MCTLPIIVLGILALRHNGVSAIDGGFLQVLMTTATGRTKMEVAAAQGCLGSHENVPEALKKLKVRFGELNVIDRASMSAKAGISDLQVPVLEEFDTEIDQYSDHVPLVHLVRDPEDNDEDRLERIGSQIEAAFSKKSCEPGTILSRRTGFGDPSETIHLRRGSRLQDSRPSSVRARSVWRFALPSQGIAMKALGLGAG